MQPSDTTRVDHSSPTGSAGTTSSGYTSGDYRNYRHASLGPSSLEQLRPVLEPRFWSPFAPANLVAPQNAFDIPRHNPNTYLPDYPQAPFFPQTPHAAFPDATDYARPHPQPPQQLPYAAPQSPLYAEPTAIMDVPPRPAFLSHLAAERLGSRLTLAALSNANPRDAKPNYPYPTLIRAAILGSPRQALTLQGIYDALRERYEWFRDHWQDKAWKVRSWVFGNVTRRRADRGCARIVGGM